MRETRLARESANERPEAPRQEDSPADPIRILDDLELALAGGGDQVGDWP